MVDCGIPNIYDRNVFLECLQDAIDEKFTKDGPIRKLLAHAQKVAKRKKKKIHVIFSGGGSKSRLLYQRAVKEFEGESNGLVRWNWDGIMRGRRSLCGIIGS